MFSPCRVSLIQSKEWHNALDEISKNRGILHDTNVVDSCVELFNTGEFKFD